jgi:2-polyprenyl-3-methyl-5-hydroxy-6-metoxy-1,4-benzoquinol methylase
VFDVADYWQQRYVNGGDSGSGSQGAAVEAKAVYINQIIREYKLKSIIDWGCGDGELAMRVLVPHYTGLDVAPAAVEMCCAKMPSREWLVYDGFSGPDITADMALSVDVLFHLIDDGLYRRYLELLFDSASLVCVSASNRDEAGRAHVLHRAFLKDVPEDWRVVDWPAQPSRVGMWLFQRGY